MPILSRQEIQETNFFWDMFPGSKIPILGLTDFSKIWVLHLVPGSAFKKEKIFQLRNRSVVIQFLYQVTLYKNLFLQVNLVIPSVVTWDFPVSYLWSIYLT